MKCFEARADYAERRLHGAKTSELFSIIQIRNPCRGRADSNLCKNPATRTTVLINMDQFDVLPPGTTVLCRARSLSRCTLA